MKQNEYNQIEKALSLADNWDIASKIWHNNKEKETLRKIAEHIKLRKSDKVIDVACGTGFHSICFRELGLNIFSSDIDKGNLEKFSELITKKKIFIPLIRADWLNINEIINNKFNAVFCLGSSITYFESWNENHKINFNNRKVKLIRILCNYKELLESNGSLVIGYSKHYYTDRENTIIKYGKSIPLNGSYFEMNWHLYFNWNNKIKHWKCEIKDIFGNDYSFELESHLYSLEEFIEICKEVFNDVNTIDLDKDYYDVFVICK